MLGLRSGVSIRMGQPMKVRIVSVNVPGRQLNLTPAEPLTGSILAISEKRVVEMAKSPYEDPP